MTIQYIIGTDNYVDCLDNHVDCLDFESTVGEQLHLFDDFDKNLVAGCYSTVGEHLVDNWEHLVDNWDKNLVGCYRTDFETLRERDHLKN